MATEQNTVLSALSCIVPFSPLDHAVTKAMLETFDEKNHEYKPECFGKEVQEFRGYVHKHISMIARAYASSRFNFGSIFSGGGEDGNRTGSQ